MKPDTETETTDLAVDASEIPLPPEELSRDWDAEPEAAEAEKAKVEDTPPAEIAELDFLEEPSVTVTLRYPFRFDGREVRTVTIRPLSVAETGGVIQANRDASVHDFYAVMTGLPAAVIRALPGEDGEAVTGAAFDFLPRFMRGGG
ncbi:phage tail assembly protein [Notoacmeibacter ruber]|uniref:Phage tail assembly protein n=1 Tax=Notoacmeibacter ruber TaxID=2670375 RepID=A0A3L7JF17_9HYPH|nr:phage tail assembly protein [Notoacmeibacter ruber]RLQ88925.1 phage tail assembly protein [Notoacmeibacter ruber]